MEALSNAGDSNPVWHGGCLHEIRLSLMRGLHLVSTNDGAAPRAGGQAAGCGAKARAPSSARTDRQGSNSGARVAAAASAAKTGAVRPHAAQARPPPRASAAARSSAARSRAGAPAGVRVRKLRARAPGPACAARTGAGLQAGAAGSGTGVPAGVRGEGSCIGPAPAAEGQVVRVAGEARGVCAPSAPAPRPAGYLGTGSPLCGEAGVRVPAWQTLGSHSGSPRGPALPRAPVLEPTKEAPSAGVLPCGSALAGARTATSFVARLVAGAQRLLHEKVRAQLGSSSGSSMGSLERGCLRPSRARMHGGLRPSPTLERGGLQPIPALERCCLRPSRARKHGGLRPSPALECGGLQPIPALERSVLRLSGAAAVHTRADIAGAVGQGAGMTGCKRLFARDADTGRGSDPTCQLRGGAAAPGASSAPPSAPAAARAPNPDLSSQAHGPLAPWAAARVRTLTGTLATASSLRPYSLPKGSAAEAPASCNEPRVRSASDGKPGCRPRSRSAAEAADELGVAGLVCCVSAGPNPDPFAWLWGSSAATSDPQPNPAAGCRARRGGAILAEDRACAAGGVRGLVQGAGAQPPMGLATIRSARCGALLTWLSVTR